MKANGRTMSVKPGLQTIDDLLALPDDGKRYELHDGVIVEVGTSSRDHTKVGARIVGLLTIWQIESNAGGEITTADGTFQLDEHNYRVPDAAYVSAERAKTLPHGTVFYPFVPDLAVEIRSPSQSDDDMDKLAKLYLRKGSRLVWTADFAKRSIKVYRSGQKPLEVSGNGVLDGYDVLPGLKIRVADIFKVLEA